MGCAFGIVAEVDDLTGRRRRTVQRRPRSPTEPARLPTVESIGGDDPGDHVGLHRGEGSVGQPDGDDGLTIGSATKRAIDVADAGRRPEHRHLEAATTGDCGHRPDDLGKADGGRLIGDGGEMSNWHEVIQAPGSDSGERPVTTSQPQRRSGEAGVQERLEPLELGCDVQVPGLVA